MRYVGLDNDTRGITVSCNIRGIVSIHAHTRGETVQFYEIIEAKVLGAITWVYFPLAEKETITAGWVREVDTPLNDRQPALVLRTSLYRTCIFGPYVPQDRRHIYRFQPLGNLSASPTGVCYNDMGIASASHFRLGLTYDVQGTNDWVLSDPHSGDMDSPPDSTIPQWFYSSASLDGAIQIRLCVDKQKQHVPCIGILLVYVDHEESLGQWRYDRDIEDMVLPAPIYVFSGNDSTAGPYVRVVGSREQEGGDWREITGTDRIVWWFTSECSIVVIRTAGQAS
ncbi:hypothetical protein K469DRAFT_779146 [Zopfia rhizophila CBS 207.26]|uniref:Uncharacterized protein n=1 Tax=Zopfia rhizophila CBS 207.26 TaxID=1314779 RepID=A0A6A6E536_9PEZI|nr:hypothetical protein K469DRAFT_779146 [Zopfia rhizophila CBS 207.26]